MTSRQSPDAWAVDGIPLGCPPRAERLWLYDVYEYLSQTLLAYIDDLDKERTMVVGKVWGAKGRAGVSVVLGQRGGRP